MQSKASSVEQYLDELPSERRHIIERVRAVVRQNLDGGYEEGMLYGMIGYYVPHRLYPPGYHVDPEKPLGFICLASQKNYLSLYLGHVCGHADNGRWFREAWQKTGKKLDMGKSCLRFKNLEDLALDVIAESIRRMPVQAYIAFYESAMALNRREKTGPSKSLRKKKEKKKTMKASRPKAGHRRRSSAAGKKSRRVS